MSNNTEKQAYRAVKTWHDGKPVYVAEQPVLPYRLLQDNGSKYFGASWDKAEQPRGEATLTPATELREQQEGPKPKFVRNVDGVPCITLVEHEYLMRSRTSLQPSQRSVKPWVGLSTDEIYDMYNEPRSDAEMVEFARAIEAKLKEKNGF